MIHHWHLVYRPFKKTNLVMPYHEEEKSSVGGVCGSVCTADALVYCPFKKTNLVMPYHGEQKGSVGGVRGSVQQMLSCTVPLRKQIS